MLKDRRLPRQGVSQVIRTLEKLTHGLFTGFRQRSPDKIASIERRRRLAASGSVPAHPVGCYAGSLHIDAIAAERRSPRSGRAVQRSRAAFRSARPPTHRDRRTPRKLTPFQRQEALARLEAGETQADVARSYGVDATTIGRLQ
jgi:hypothetical protein